MGSIASQITSFMIVYSAVDSGADQRKQQNSAALAFVWGLHWWPVNSPHKWPVTRKMFPFDDAIMIIESSFNYYVVKLNQDLRSLTESTSTIIMMTSSNGSFFRVIGPLWEEFINHRWIPLTKDQ